LSPEIERSVRTYSAHLVSKKAESSVAHLDKNRSEIHIDTYVLNRREEEKPSKTFPAHFGNKKAKSPYDPRAGFGLSPEIERHGPKMFSILQSRKHNGQLVSVTMTVTKSTAKLTSCCIKREPSRPECVAHFERKIAQSSVGPQDHSMSAWDTYALWRQDRAIRSQTFFGHSLQAR
jgi:hypothetical protein